MKASKVPFNERIVVIEDTEGKKQVVNLEYLLMIDSVVNLQNGGKIYTGDVVIGSLYFRSGEKDTLFEGVLCPLRPSEKIQEYEEIIKSWKLNKGEL